MSYLLSTIAVSAEKCPWRCKKDWKMQTVQQTDDENTMDRKFKKYGSFLENETIKTLRFKVRMIHLKCVVYIMRKDGLDNLILIKH